MYLNEMLVFPWGLSLLRSGQTYFFILLSLILSGILLDWNPREFLDNMVHLYSRIISSFRRKMYPERLELKGEH